MKKILKNNTEEIVAAQLEIGWDDQEDSNLRSEIEQYYNEPL